MSKLDRGGYELRLAIDIEAWAETARGDIYCRLEHPRWLSRAEMILADRDTMLVLWFTDEHDAVEFSLAF